MDDRLAVVSALAVSLICGNCEAQSARLPAGDYMLFGGNDHAANFVVMDSLRRSESRVSVTNYRVYANEIPSPNGPIQQDLTELDLDCSARTSTTRAIHAFRSSGAWVVSFGPEPTRPIEANETWDFLARIACDGVRLPASQVVRGADAARDLGLAQLR